jgi:hypothetical protein
MLGYPPSKATPHVRYVVASHRVWHKNCSSESVARLPRAKSLYTCSYQRWIPNQTTERKFVARRSWGGQPKQPLHLLNYWTILPHPLSSDTLHCINTVTLAILIWTTILETHLIIQKRVKSTRVHRPSAHRLYSLCKGMILIHYEISPWIRCNVFFFEKGSDALVHQP